MRWLIGLFALALATAGTTSLALAQGGPTAVICGGFEHQWNAVKGGTNAAAMRTVIEQINPSCGVLLREARERLATVERRISAGPPRPPTEPQTISPAGAICAPYESRWDPVARGTDAAAMRRAIALIPPGCETLLHEARQRLLEVESQAAGSTRGATPAIITNPDWDSRPTGDDVAEFYPERAARMGVNGHATLSCVVTAAGTLEDCAILSENPPDFGFGEAALKLSGRFTMKPMTRDGVPVSGGRVIIPIGFNVPSDGPPVAPDAAAPASPAHASRSFVVYFPVSDSSITAEAQAVVQSAAVYANLAPSARVVVVGNAMSGEAGDGMVLSERRAKATADFLVSQGIAASSLDVSWKGATDPAVPGSAGIPEPLNRRVTITVVY